MLTRKLIFSLISSNFHSFEASSSIQPIRLLSRMAENAHLKGRKLIAVCQLNCKANKEENYNVSEKLIQEASSNGCSMAFLPECFDMINETRKDTLAKLEPLDGPLITKYRDLAKSCNIWLSLGGLHEKREHNEDGKASNAHIVINSSGEIVSVYRKTHLFNLDIPGVVHLVESEFSVAGDKIVPPVQTPVGKLGLGICYDVRFPELAISLAKAGADILSYPSSFTVPTGSAHWETLLRCRAIENQCYVVAAAQTGFHNSKRSSWGHSMVVDPWGSIIAQVGEEVGLAIAIIDPELQRKVRAKLPVWTDRRSDLYGEVITPIENCDPDAESEYNFGPVKIHPSQVFYRTQHSYAFVNHRPFLPGHSLVAPLRAGAVRVTDLTSAEITDFFTCIQKVQKALETEYSATSSSIAIQDGPDAGRSVEHLHAHVVARKPNDFEADFIFALATHDKSDKPIRSASDMKAESDRMRKYFYH
ncbi:deaminated glutathione amidase [Tetranychus urticae]|uniref:Nitrilase and fragile histidine triad fusion protein NitFhit n=1 Tax=Tetranychus urticae TaxID=32264 RepID=T1K686_TETUR|nr:deaminated glutathione amidase [Tetranychus urticae]